MPGNFTAYPPCLAFALSLGWALRRTVWRELVAWLLGHTQGQDEVVTISVEDRLSIHELVSLHGHIVDDGRLDRLHQLFTRDVVYDLTPMGGGVLVGIDSIRDASLMLGDDNPVGHHVTNIVVSQERDQVTARSKAIGVRKDGSTGSLVYDDVLVRTNAGWRISKRTITLRRNPLQP